MGLRLLNKLILDFTTQTDDSHAVLAKIVSKRLIKYFNYYLEYIGKI